MEPGKLPLDVLQRLLAKVAVRDDRVLVSGGVGEDAAVISFGDRMLVAKTDPITFASDLIGWYAVNVNANDIAATGARPSWFLATVLLPPAFSEEQTVALFDQLVDACRHLDIALVGGHTEITLGLERPIVVGCMLGEAGPRGIVRTGGALPGDDLVLTKGLAVEGTALLAREAEAILLSRGVDAALIARAKNLLFEPGISVVPEALLALRLAAIHSMHDPTEGGLATALLEVGMASATGIWVERDAIPILPETAAICAALGLDPLGLLASGSLIVALPGEATAQVVAGLEAAGIRAVRIGAVVEAGAGFRLLTPGGWQPLPRFARDEVARFFSP